MRAHGLILLATLALGLSGCFGTVRGRVSYGATVTADVRVPAEVIVSTPPPPVLAEVETPEAQPAASAAWVGGHHEWRGRWVWVPGHWESDREGYVWVAPVARQHGRRIVYHAGYWVRVGQEPPRVYREPSVIVVAAPSPGTVVQPARPAQPVVVQPARPARPVVVQPARPAEPARPIVVQPARPAEPAQPARPIVVQPARPAQPARPVVVQPARPAEPAQPSRPVVVAPARPIVEPARPVAPAQPPLRPTTPPRAGVERPTTTPPPVVARPAPAEPGVRVPPTPPRGPVATERPQLPGGPMTCRIDNAQAPMGGVVAITGTGFTSAARVRIAGRLVRTVEQSPGRIVVRVPDQIGGGRVTITEGDVTASCGAIH